MPGFTEKTPVPGEGRDGFAHDPSTDTFKIPHIPTYSEIVDRDSAAEYGGAPSSGVLGRTEPAEVSEADKKAIDSAQSDARDRGVLPYAWDAAERDNISKSE